MKNEIVFQSHRAECYLALRDREESAEGILTTRKRWTVQTDKHDQIRCIYLSFVYRDQRCINTGRVNTPALQPTAPVPIPIRITGAELQSPTVLLFRSVCRRTAASNASRCFDLSQSRGRCCECFFFSGRLTACLSGPCNRVVALAGICGREPCVGGDDCWRYVVPSPHVG